MIDPHWVLLGAALSILGSARYAVATVRGQTRPNRVTWLLWGLAPVVGFFAQLDDGVGLTSVMTLSIGLGPLIVFASSFVNRLSYWRLSAFDLACGGVSALALGVWLTLDDPASAVLLAVLADLVAGLPTIAKAWRAPGTEHPAPFVLGGMNGAITLFAIDDWAPHVWAFPVYLTALAVVLTALVAFRLGERIRPHGSPGAA